MTLGERIISDLLETRLAPRTRRKVDDSVHPFFGVDTEELVSLRKLADAVQEYLDEKVSFEDLGELLKLVRKIQKGKHSN